MQREAFSRPEEAASAKTPEWEREWPGPQNERAQAKARRVAGPWRQLWYLDVILSIIGNLLNFWTMIVREIKLVMTATHLHSKVNVCQVVLRQDRNSLRKMLYPHLDGKWSGIDPWPQLWVIQYLPFQRRYSIQHKSENQNCKEPTVLHLPRDSYIFIPVLEYKYIKRSSIILILKYIFHCQSVTGLMEIVLRLH